MKQSLTKSYACVLAFGGALLVLPAGARAESEASPQAERRPASSDKLDKTEGKSANARRAQAQTLYEQAARAYASRRNFEAIELFRQSAELEPSPLLSYNMALAYEEAGDVRNALKHFRRYLESSPRADDAEEVRNRISKLESKLERLGIQQLTVTSHPVGATLFIDGVAVGVTPFTGEFAPGSHALALSLQGHRDTRVNVELPKSHALEVPLTLEKQASPRSRSSEHQAPHSTAPASERRDSGLGRVQPLSWGLLGVGAGSLTAGILFEVSRAKSNREARDADNAVDAAEAQGAADGKQLASLMLLGAGGAFLVTGGVLALLDTRAERPAVSKAQPAGPRTPVATLASAGCVPGFCGIELAGRF